MTLQDFGVLSNGQTVHRIVIGNERLSLGLLTLGATVQSLTLDNAPMVIGSDTIADYLGPLQYFGAIVGRVANRLDGASAMIAGQRYKFDANEANGNCLHGGQDGASAQIWTLVESSDEHAVFGLTLPDGHMGFPGKIDVQARYQVNDLTLRLDITAQSDAQTLCSFAPHSYWNLAGAPDINDHEMQIDATEYLPVTENGIPTGEIASVRGTEFDFLEMRKLGNTSLDHNFCISTERHELRPVLWLKNRRSGVSLEVASTETGLQIYDARHCGCVGLAIEPQIWPDAINQAGFPNMILNPGEVYHATSEFRLSKSAHS